MKSETQLKTLWEQWEFDWFDFRVFTCLVEFETSLEPWNYFWKFMVLTYIQCGYFSLGFLKKLRKEGKIYLGSKYQKRYCVVRNHIFYYYREKKSHKQAGHILLPGYKAQVSNKKGREFTLTHSDGYRTFQVTNTSFGHGLYHLPRPLIISDITKTSKTSKTFFFLV